VIRTHREETRKANRAIFDRLEIIQSQLEGEERQLQRLLDLYLFGDFPKEMLMEKRSRLEQTIANLKMEQNQLASHLNTVSFTDQDIGAVEDYCLYIRENLDLLTFDGKRRILELLDVRGTLAIENDEKVIYISCLIYPQPVSLALTSHSSNTGGIKIPSCASLPMVRSQ